MATIIIPTITNQIPNRIIFNQITQLSQACKIDVSLNTKSFNSVNVIVVLQMVLPNLFRFSSGKVTEELEFNNIMDNAIVSIDFRTKLITHVPQGGLPNVIIRVIVWDASSQSQSDKRFTKSIFTI